MRYGNLLKNRVSEIHIDQGVGVVDFGITILMYITFFKESLLSYLAGLFYYRVRLELLAGNKVSQQIDHFIIPGPSKPGGQGG